MLEALRARLAISLLYHLLDLILITTSAIILVYSRKEMWKKLKIQYTFFLLSTFNSIKGINHCYYWTIRSFRYYKL